MIFQEKQKILSVGQDFEIISHYIQANVPHILSARLWKLPKRGAILLVYQLVDLQLRVSAGLAPASPLILPIRG